MSGSNMFDPEEIERQLAVKLSMTALQGEGSISAARQVLEVLDRIRSRQAAEDHRRLMNELADKPIDLIRYLGYLGEEAQRVEEHLASEMGEAERKAYDEGRRRRQLELRAVELDRAVRGRGKPTPWMRT